MSATSVLQVNVTRLAGMNECIYRGLDCQSHGFQPPNEIDTVKTSHALVWKTSPKSSFLSCEVPTICHALKECFAQKALPSRLHGISGYKSTEPPKFHVFFFADQVPSTRTAVTLAKSSKVEVCHFVPWKIPTPDPPTAGYELVFYDCSNSFLFPAMESAYSISNIYIYLNMYQH